MTTRKAFTLLELLVVVLIIGILAAIAVPQYQKTVEKSRATQALTLLKSVYQAQQVYHMANGTYAKTFNELGMNIPWTGNKKWYTGGNTTDTRSNDMWSLQIVMNDTYPDLWLGRISGPYKGTGFVQVVPSATTKEWYRCAERVNTGITYEGEAGSYCGKIFGGRLSHSGTYRGYSLPDSK